MGDGEARLNAFAAPAATVKLAVVPVIKPSVAVSAVVWAS